MAVGLYSSLLSTVDNGVFGSMGRSVTERRFFHFCTMLALMPQRFASALTLSWLSWIARRTVSVVRAQPWRTWPQIRPSRCGDLSYHHTTEPNT